MFKRNNSPKSNSSGAALVEFLITFPLLLLLFSGVLELGRMYSQLTWVSNIGYEVAWAGAASPQGPAGMADMAAKHALLSSITKFHKLSAPPAMPNPVYNTSGSNTVSVEIDANVSPMMNMFSGNLRSKITSPMLASSGAGSGPMDRFMNPSCLYSCNGVQISPCCSSSACAPSHC